MKYLPSLPERNDNVTNEHPLRDVAVILGWLLAAAALAFWLTGIAVDAVVDNLDPETEARLHSLAPQAPAAAEAGAAPRAAPLQALVDSMRGCAGVRIPLTVSVHESDIPNAAVMPGGHIVVFSGLLGHVRSENGLAFVLAHELAHLANRDHLRAMGRGIVIFGVTAVLTGSDSGLADLLAPVGQFGQARYSRTREAAADATALRILACRYGHAGGATELFESLRGRDESLFGLSHYMASHPGMDERIAAVRRGIAAGKLGTGTVLPLTALP